MKFLILLTTLICLSGCASTPESEKAELSNIVGTWAEFIDSENNIMIYATYFPDGRYHTYGYIPDDKKTYFFADGRWRIENGLSCITVSYESTGFFTPGDKVCNRIVKLTHSEFVYEINGHEISMKRVNYGKL